MYLKKIHCLNVQQINRRKNTKMINNYQKEVQTKLTKTLLDTIILQFLSKESMHGYQLITTIRRSFGIYFGPSTVYPLLGHLEKKGYVKSSWNMNSERPKKVYSLTDDGKSLLNFAESSLNLICKDMASDNIGTKSSQISARPTLQIRTHL
jgi:DNA-binding PadR family transcriptional regulator